MKATSTKKLGWENEASVEETRTKKEEKEYQRRSPGLVKDRTKPTEKMDAA